MPMKTPVWLKPALQGAATGAIVLAIVGFTWGGWVTGSTAAKMASEQAKTEVLAALVPICLDQSNKDPQLADKLAGLGRAQYYERGDLLMKTGWATMPGAADPNRLVASACAEKLSAVLAAGAKPKS